MGVAPLIAYVVEVTWAWHDYILIVATSLCCSVWPWIGHERETHHWLFNSMGQNLLNNARSTFTHTLALSQGAASGQSAHS